MEPQLQYSQFFASMGHQLEKLWQEMGIPQKIALIGTTCLFVMILIFGLSGTSNSSYTLLYPKEQLLPADAAEVRTFLDQHQINYKIEGSTGIQVPLESASKIRLDLASAGLPKQHSNKGFELFDSNSWMEGEKELQITQMRAIEGHLEQDISQYDNIQSVHISLDTTVPRAASRFNSDKEANKIKASVILGLKPGAHLNDTEIRAITYHISGAVRGLEPNMIAISDTAGKLYQAMDVGNPDQQLQSKEMAFEDRLKNKIDEMLSVVVGAGNFYSTVQVTLEPKEASVSVLINKTPSLQALKSEIESQLTAILEGYHLSLTKPKVDFIPFEQHHPAVYQPEEDRLLSLDSLGSALLAFIFVAAGLVWTFKRFWRQQEAPAQFLEGEVSDQFTFEDIASLNDASARALVSEIDLSDLSVALKEASREVKQKILSNLTEEQAQQLHVLLTQKGFTNSTTAQEARERIVACVHQLDSQGRMVILAKQACLVKG